MSSAVPNALLILAAGSVRDAPPHKTNSDGALPRTCAVRICDSTSSRPCIFRTVGSTLSGGHRSSRTACAILNVMSPLVRWTLWLTVAGLAACGAIGCRYMAPRRPGTVPRRLHRQCRLSGSASVDGCGRRRGRSGSNGSPSLGGGRCAEAVAPVNCCSWVRSCPRRTERRSGQRMSLLPVSFSPWNWRRIADASLDLSAVYLAPVSRPAPLVRDSPARSGACASVRRISLATLSARREDGRR